MIDIATSLSINTSTSINEAMELPVSLAIKVFDSKSFDNYKKHREHDGKVQSEIINRLNGVIRGLGILAKSFRG